MIRARERTRLLLAFAAFFAPHISLAETPALSRHTCPNGLEVLVAEQHATPLVTIEVTLRNGAMNEPPSFNGLSHLYEHMFFKGNASLPNQLVSAARQRSLGVQTNAVTETERVSYFFTTTPDHFADSMVLMKDSLTRPLFDPEELARERVVVLGELDQKESIPSYRLWAAVNEHVFWRYPSRATPLGTRATVSAATPLALRTIQSRFYVPQNAVLIVVGDVKAAAVFAQAETIYAAWTRGADPFAKFPLVEHPAIQASEVVVVPAQVQDLTATVVWRGPSTRDPRGVDSYASQMLEVLASDPTSRFQRALVDTGRCSWAAVGGQAGYTASEVSIQFGSSLSSVDACVEAVFSEVRKMAAPNYFSREEMDGAAMRAQRMLAEQRETTSRFAHTISEAWAAGGDGYYEGFEDRLLALTPRDIGGFVERFIVERHFVFGAMLPQEAIDKGMNGPRLRGLAGLGSSK